MVGGWGETSNKWRPHYNPPTPTHTNTLNYDRQEAFLKDNRISCFAKSCIFLEFVKSAFILFKSSQTIKPTDWICRLFYQVVSCGLSIWASAQELRFQIQQFQVGGKRDSAFKVVVKSRESPLNQFRRSIFINRAHTGRVVNWNPSARWRFWFSPFSKEESGVTHLRIIKYHGSSWDCLHASL